MKKLDIFLILVFLCQLSTAAVITSDGLNNSSSLFTVSGGSYYTGNSAAGDRPATSPFAIEGSHAYGMSNGTATLTSSSINTGGYSSIQLSLRLAAFSIGSTGNGMDAADLFKIEISPDGGTNWWSTITVNGNSNAYWAYSATGVATTAYDGNNTPVAFTPGGGGSRTTDGYSTVNITSLPAVANLQIRITLFNNSTNERWLVDDVQLTGILSCSPPADPTGSISGTTPACTNTALSFSGSAPAGITYYWETAALGTATANDAASSLNVSTSGNYYVRAQDNGTFCWSTGAIGPYAVVINTAVSITASPVNKTVSSGNTAAFSVTSTGTSLTYQWQENQGSGWNNITGATSVTYTTPATTFAMDGWQYRCIVSGASPCASVTSSSATLTVTTPLTAGFEFTSGSIIENAGTYQIGVTVNTAPGTDLVLRVADAGTGTASAVTDFTFSTTDLTFLASGTYPQTQYATVTILNDALPESNKYRNFSLTRISGSAVTPSPSVHQMTIIDDDVTEGVVLNEFSQGAGNAAYIELVVIGVPGTTVDLRGWIIDDNSGIFSGGYGTQLGIADGHIKFSNICTWEKVPVGSIIVIYANDQTGGTPAKNGKITSLGLADDETDANLDYVYVVGVNYYNSGQCSSASANSYFSSDCNLPSNTSYDSYTPSTYVSPDMGTVQFRNAGDAVQIRDQSGTYFMGLSYGNKGGGSNCITCAMNANNHPDFATYGSNALYFSGTTNVTYANEDSLDYDYRYKRNWAKTTSPSPNALETPGSPNNTANNTWIQSLRANFDIVTDDQNYTCQLRQYESRFYLDAVDKIIFYIKNNANVDHGDLTAETYFYNTASIGRGFENDFISASPTLFMEKTWIGTPTITSASTNYKIRFYVNNTELQNYCDYVNHTLDVYYALTPGTMNYTPATIIPKLYLYRTGGSVRAWTAASSIQVEQVTPVHGAYGSYTYFEYDGFLAFSGYALGNEIVPTGISNTLPVELTNFSGSCVDDQMVLLNWNTASEINSKEFILQHSSDGEHFASIKNIAASGFSNSPKSYAAVDSSVTANENYYRLIEVDKDGKQTIHKMIFVKCSGVDVLQTYYSPEEGIVVQMNADADKEMQFNMYEISGKLIYHESKNIVKSSSRFTLNTGKNLAKGVYILQTIDGNDVHAGKLLIH
ncbi:MAG: hypothetical protein JWN78_2835 [Bacteroidota bacterium]|nr:hypothetical protein [Bacteroidota bacterium]